MEGVALQRRNRSTSIGYDTFEVASQSDTASGVDAILTAAAAVAQSISTSPTDNLAMMNGRPLKKYVRFIAS